MLNWLFSFLFSLSKQHFYNMTNPYTIPNINMGPDPVQLPQQPPAIHMSNSQPSAPAPHEPTQEELLVQAMSILDHEGFDFHRQDPNWSQHAGPVENTMVMIRDDSKGKSLLKEPPVFDGDKKKYWEFKQKLSCWLKDPKNKVKDDNKKINKTLSYISYVTLLKKLDEWFLEVSQHEDAREAFDRIKMMPGECAETFFEHFKIMAGIC